MNDDVKRPESGVNPEPYNPSSIGSYNANLTADILARQISDVDSRVRRLESRDKPFTSFLRSLKRLTNISSFVLVLSPLLLTVSVLLTYILLNPTLALSNAIITIFGFVGLVSLAEIIIVPIWVGAIQNKLNKIIEKHYPNEDM
jgi:hypothetical protein